MVLNTQRVISLDCEICGSSKTYIYRSIEYILTNDWDLVEEECKECLDCGNIVIHYVEIGE